MNDTTFGGLSAREWDDLAGGNFYSTSRWQRFCTLETQTPGSAIVSHAGGRAAWAVPVRELAGLQGWSRYRWNDHLGRFGLPLLGGAGMLIGAPEGFQTHLLASQERPAAALRDLVAGIRDACRAAGTGRSCVAMFISTADARALRSAGVTAQPVLLDTDAWIPVPEGGWPAWLETFPGKRRRNICREDRAFLQAGYHIEHMPLSRCWTRLGNPAASTMRKYGHHVTPESELSSMEHVVEVFGDEAKVAVCHRDGDTEPVGFCIYYRHGDTIFIRWAGLDNDRLAGVEEYFSLLYYTQVKRAPGNGTRWIHAGATAHAAKALRGALLRPLWLLDLTEDSPLSCAGDAVRRHNASLYERLADDPRIVRALQPMGDWTGFS